MVVFAVTAPGQAATTQYVDTAVVGGDNDGTSWTDAFTNLQDALVAAAPEESVVEPWLDLSRRSQAEADDPFPDYDTDPVNLSSVALA